MFIGVVWFLNISPSNFMITREIKLKYEYEIFVQQDSHIQICPNTGRFVAITTNPTYKQMQKVKTGESLNTLCNLIIVSSQCGFHRF